MHELYPISGTFFTILLLTVLHRETVEEESEIRGL